MDKEKIIWENPVLIDMSSLPARGGCRNGSNGGSGNCQIFGGDASNKCMNGSYAGSACGNGTVGIGGTITRDGRPIG